MVHNLLFKTYPVGAYSKYSYLMSKFFICYVFRNKGQVQPILFTETEQSCMVFL